MVLIEARLIRGRCRVSGQGDAAVDEVPERGIVRIAIRIGINRPVTGPSSNSMFFSSEAAYSVSLGCRIL